MKNGPESEGRCQPKVLVFFKRPKTWKKGSAGRRVTDPPHHCHFDKMSYEKIRTERSVLDAISAINRPLQVNHSIIINSIACIEISSIPFIELKSTKNVLITNDFH